LVVHNTKERTEKFDRFAVGKLVGCFGIKGFLKLQPYTHSLSRLEKIKRVYIGESAETSEPLIVEQVLFNNRSIVVKFSAVNDRTSAEKLVGMVLFLEESDRIAPRKGSYYIDDIIGCEVWSTDGCFLGTVEEVYKLPAQDVWAIRNKTKVSLIPAVKEFIQKIDVQNRKIVVRVIEGLVEW
jgi:16S rRNA processing protein RimM